MNGHSDNEAGRQSCRGRTEFFNEQQPLHQAIGDCADRETDAGSLSMLRCPAAAALIACAIPASAEPLPTAGKWVVDYAESYCILSRHGTGAEPGIAFRTRPFADEHDLLIYFAKTGEKYVSARGRIFIGNDEGVEHGMAMAEPVGRPYRYLDTSISAEELSRVAASGSMRVAIKGKLDVTVPLPDMPRALAALRTCEDDLARKWQAEVGWAKPPVLQKGMYRLVGPRDYPSVAVAKNQTGLVRVLLRIDKKGAVASCKVIETSGAPLLDKRTCDIFLKRARFEPAFDANGKPVASSYVPPGVNYRILRRDW